VPNRTQTQSPIGQSASEARARRAARSVEYQEIQAELEPWEQIARIVIRRRMELNLTQVQLAERMGTSHSAISRIESGHHRVSQDSLRRLGKALELQYVIGFQGTADKGERIQELVAL